MRANLYLTPLAACLALTMASSNAAEPLALQKASFSDLKQEFQLHLPGVKYFSRSSDSLNFLKERTDKNQITHVRMQQKYAGFIVFGGYAIMHSQSHAKTLIATNQQVQMNGVVYRGLKAELGQPSVDFVKNGTLALEHFKTAFVGKELSEEQVIPIVYIDKQNKAHWAYRVSFFVQHYDKIPERPTAIIDAKSNKVFLQWNNIKTAYTEYTKVKGMGFGGNSKTGEIAYGKNYPFLELSRDEQADLCYMENTDVKIVDMLHNYFSFNKPMKFDCPKTDTSDSSDLFTVWTGYKGDGYDRENGAFSPTNDALYVGYVIKHMYQDWYNLDVLTKNEKPMQLVMRVHYGKGYENAYWDGKQMTFGDGKNLFHPLVSLGIGSHEISHGFTEQHSDLEYVGHSGGMNEAFSDMAAQAAEFYSSGTNNWSIGGEILKEESGYDAIRYMDKPSRDGQSIDSADQYVKDLNVHYSSGVFNRLFYLMAQQSGWGVRKAFDVMVKANMDWWTPTSTFTEGGCGVLAATKDLGFSVDDVKKVLDQVAIKYESCEIAEFK